MSLTDVHNTLLFIKDWGLSDIKSALTQCQFHELQAKHTKKVQTRTVLDTECIDKLNKYAEE